MKKMRPTLRQPVEIRHEIERISMQSRTVMTLLISEEDDDVGAWHGLVFS